MQIDINALARVGAKARLAELTAEMDAIHSAFPDLRARQDVIKPKASYWGRRRKSAATLASAAELIEEPKAKRTMSAEAPARISAAQKRRWAQARRGKKR
jgi:hypothetical protein